MASVELSNLRKVFRDDKEGEVVAVDDLDITVADGEFLVLVGPSGCGKSTTLRLIAGLERETAGEIRLDDTVVNEKKPKDRDIAMVFQNYALYPHMTVRENMGFSLKMTTDLSRTEIAESVEEIAALLGIEELLDRQPKELSGGQKQRVALGRAIVREPEVFLMDEPLSNLDAKLRREMRTELQRLHDTIGTTTIYVTHDQTEAMTMGDRLAVLRGGELQQIGTPLECYYSPANVFVGSFIGSPQMNFFTVTKRRRDGSVTLENELVSAPIDDASESLLATGDELVLGIRPESLTIADDDDAMIRTTVDVVEPMGKETLAYFSFQDETYTAVLPGNQLLTGGTEIAFTCDQSDLYVFESSSERSLRTPDFDSVEGDAPVGDIARTASGQSTSDGGVADE